MYKRSTSLRLTNILFLSQSFASASQTAIFTLMAIMAAELSGSNSWAGFPSTLLTVSIALAALPTSQFMARFGRRIGLTLSYALSGFGALLGVIAIVQGWFWLFLLSASFIGLGRAGGDQSRYIPGEIFPEAERARMIGRVVFAGVAGAVSGPLTVAPSLWLTSFLGLDENTGPWLMAILFYLAAATLIFFLLRPEPLEIAHELDGEGKKKKNEEAVNSENQERLSLIAKIEKALRALYTNISDLMSIPRARLAVLSMIVSQATMVTLMVMTPLHMNHLNHDKGSISLVLSGHVFGMYGLAALTGYLIDRFGRITMMIVAAVTLMLAAIIAPLGSQLPFLFIGLFLLGLGWSFGYVAGSALLVDAINPADRSRMQGTSEILVSGTAALGSLGSGIVYGAGGYISVAGMGIVLILLFIWLVRLLAPKASETQTA
jgi:MFS family permease